MKKLLLLFFTSLNVHSYPSFINTDESSYCEQQDYNTAEISEESQIINCILNEQSKVKLELKNTYDKVLSMLTKREKKIFIRNQKKWELIRDNDCTFVKDIYQQGNYNNLVKEDCITFQNKNRIYYLNAILNINK